MLALTPELNPHRGWPNAAGLMARICKHDLATQTDTTQLCSDVHTRSWACSPGGCGWGLQLPVDLMGVSAGLVLGVSDGCRLVLGHFGVRKACQAGSGLGRGGEVCTSGRQAGRAGRGRQGFVSRQLK
jgi:hypothetical protein